MIGGPSDSRCMLRQLRRGVVKQPHQEQPKGPAYYIETTEDKYATAFCGGSKHPTY